MSINPFLSFRGAQHPQGVRRIRKAAELPTAAQPVTEGFRPQESCPKNGIPQSSPSAMPASPIPFVPLGHFPLIRGIGLSQGGQGTGVTDCHVGPLGLLAMTGFFDSLNYTSKRTVCKHKIRNRLLLLAMHIHHSIASLLDLLIIFIVSWVKCARQAPDGFLKES